MSNPAPTLIRRLWSGSGIFQRAFRGSVWTLAGYGGQQIVRLAANLALTRLLFPEAFGLMAIVNVFVQGLVMFSDVGIGPAVARSPRGDDRAFLNTAFTIQAGRGVALWLTALALAPLLARFYNQPALTVLMPLGALVLLVQGIMPTSVESAGRHLRMGALTAIEFTASAVATVLTLLLAWHFEAVWTLALTATLAALVKLGLALKVLPGGWNRLHIDRPALSELIHFGKWLFLGTACGFLTMQADKLILGRVISIDRLGVYNIGFFLASFAPMAAHMIAGRILIPVYRDRPPNASPENFAKLRKMRLGLTGLFMSALIIMALAGPWLVDHLYDPRFVQAGPVAVLLACAQMPGLIAMTYDQSLLAAGDSRGLFTLAALRAGTLVVGLLAGAALGGLLGALIGMTLAGWAALPWALHLARKHGAFDRLHDGGFVALALAVTALAVALHGSAIAAL